MRARARDAWTRLIGPRGLAPNETYWRPALEVAVGRLAGRRGEAHRVADDRRVDVHLGDEPLQLGQALQVEDAPQLGRRLQRTLHDRELLVVTRVADQDLEHEAVDLSLRQRIRALRLDRILGCHDEERVRDEVRRLADRDLPLLHHLEQRRLHLRRRAVDLVGEQEVAEDRTELGVERLLPGPVDAGADEVRRHEVGRELDPLERAAEHVRRRLDRQRLREAGHALDQQMPAREEAHEHALEHLVLPGDHPPDLVEGGFEQLARAGNLFVHGRSLRHVGYTESTTGRVKPR